ncbi:MAG: NADH-quinone oxidoreductase subunit NuoG [Thermodesulfobacteriota bacterium]
MVTVKINGKEITVEDGTLILDAASQAGFDIPTFCYQVRLSRLGSCRMCIVEIEGQKKLQPSCVTPVINGMAVQTKSPTVISARQATLEFLLSNHALDCPVCDKGGECELQDMVYMHGPRKGRFAEGKNRFHDKDYILSPVIVKNSNRCVQCMRCVRVCDEIVGAKALGAVGRGTHQEETSFLKRELKCDQCGNCIEVCPVGCFMRLPYRYKARPWDLKGVETVCSYCGTGCQMTVQARDGEVLRVVSKPETGINNETLCARGRFGFDFVNSPDRLRIPLIKVDGEFREATWDEALSLIVSRFSGFNGRKIGGIASGRLTNEELYLFQKLIRSILKTNNLDSDTRWQEGAVESYATAMNLSGGGTSITKAMDVDSVLIVGSTISDETPVTDYIIRRLSAERNINLIISSPRRMKLDSSATVSLRPIPGSEGLFFAALVKALFEIAGSGKADLQIPLDDPRLQYFREAIDGVSDEDISKGTGLSKDDIWNVADNFSSARTVSILAGTDLLRFNSNVENLALLTDFLRIVGKEVRLLPLLDRCNQRGAWDMGVYPAFLPGYRSIRDEKARDDFSLKMDIDITNHGLGCDGMMDAAMNGELNALYVIGEDIVPLFPDGGFVKDALTKVDFLVVQDTFLTETARMADIILPGAVFTEKEGTFTNQEGRVQRLNKLLDPPGEARADWRIISDIGRMLKSSFRYDSLQDIFKEIRDVVPMYSDIDCSSLNGNGAIVRDAGYKTKDETTHHQDYISHLKKIKKRTDYDLPFILITGNHLFHSGRISKRSETLMSLLRYAFVEISKVDADKLGVQDGDKVLVEGKYYKAVTCVKVGQGSLKGIVFIPENFDDLSVNMFFKRGEELPRVRISKFVSSAKTPGN